MQKILSFNFKRHFVENSSLLMAEEAEGTNENVMNIDEFLEQTKLGEDATTTLK